MSDTFWDVFDVQNTFSSSTFQCLGMYLQFVHHLCLSLISFFTIFKLYTSQHTSDYWLIEKNYNNYVRDYYDMLDLNVERVYSNQNALVQVEHFDNFKQKLLQLSSTRCDVIFLIDSSSSIGQKNFLSILRFVKRLLVHFDISYNATRISLITFSSRELTMRKVDYISRPAIDNNKCKLFYEDLPNLALTQYFGGGTFTSGAFQIAKRIFEFSRKDVKKIIFLISDGFSNGEDPRSESTTLNKDGVEIFTVGIKSGNLKELREIATGSNNCLIVESFENLELLGKQIKQLNGGTETESKVFQSPETCNLLCKEGSNCCDSNAKCVCSPTTGILSCDCKSGFKGTGFRGSCHDVRNKSASICSDSNSQITQENPKCVCKIGFILVESKCKVVKCRKLSAPANGFFTGECRNVFNAACGIICQPGYSIAGSSIRLCTNNGTWDGEESQCIVKKCPKLRAPQHGTMNCTTTDFSFETDCHFSCANGYNLVGSRKRSCLAIAMWDGLPVHCRLSH